MEVAVQTAGPTPWLVMAVTIVSLVLWAGILYVGVQLVRVLHRLLRKL
jgi:hypothetical protein